MLQWTNDVNNNEIWTLKMKIFDQIHIWVSKFIQIHWDTWHHYANTEQPNLKTFKNTCHNFAWSFCGEKWNRIWNACPLTAHTSTIDHLMSQLTFYGFSLTLFRLGFPKFDQIYDFHTLFHLHFSYRTTNNLFGHFSPVFIPRAQRLCLNFILHSNVKLKPQLE